MESEDQGSATPAERPIGPIADLALDHASHLGETKDGFELRGCACASCGALFFPERSVCANCTSRSLRPASLGDHGVLYAWTTVHISSSRATPYSVGYVDLACGVRVLAPLSGDLGRLGSDTPVELAVSDGEWSFTVPVGSPS